MKFKELLYLLGLKPKIRTYGFELVETDLPGKGSLSLAQWLHPKAGRIEISVDEISALRKFLKPGDVAVDIGGYTGDTAIPMALVTGKTGSVIALEPNKFAFVVLQKNAEQISPFGNIIPLPFAATLNDSILTFQYSDSGFCNGGDYSGISKWKHSHAFSQKVKGKNLQEFLKAQHRDLIPRIRFIKIDTEGSDLTVLESMEEIIDQNKPYIRLEIFKLSDRKYREKIFEFLSGKKYTLHYLQASSDYKGAIISKNELMDRVHYDLFAVPDEADYFPD